jgi:hypothetical protein
LFRGAGESASSARIVPNRVRIVVRLDLTDDLRTAILAGNWSVG